jgi:hypothetical protein
MLEIPRKNEKEGKNDSVFALFSTLSQNGNLKREKGFFSEA